MNDVLRGPRLDLIPFTAELVAAMIAADAAGLESICGARFTGGIVPPLLDDHLDEQLAMLRANPESPAWNTWLAIDRDLGEAIGCAGGSAVPDDHGRLLMGWAVYPVYERRGYATEAAAAVLTRMLTGPGVTAVRATVPVHHVASVRIAEKIGMQQVGMDVDPEVGPVIVFERAAAVQPVSVASP
jgi:ribosomal-protein-alanine N-acetyltransferase